MVYIARSAVWCMYSILLPWQCVFPAFYTVAHPYSEMSSQLQLGVQLTHHCAPIRVFTSLIPSYSSQFADFMSAGRMGQSWLHCLSGSIGYRIKRCLNDQRFLAVDLARASFRYRHGNAFSGKRQGKSWWKCLSTILGLIVSECSEVIYTWPAY